MSIDIQDLVDSPLDCPFFDFHPLLPRLAFSAALTVRKFSGGTMENAGLAPAVSDAPIFVFTSLAPDPSMIFSTADSQASPSSHLIPTDAQTHYRHQRGEHSTHGKL
jgi:hypothetical protein